MSENAGFRPETDLLLEEYGPMEVISLGTNTSNWNSNPTGDDIEVLRDGLHQFNLTVSGRRYDGVPLAIWIRSGGPVLGCAYGQRTMAGST
jgi:hypothetical protein